ncbi:CCA tRNA nucleotidyltransferase [Clostridium sp.]|uniref:CCA tRNA nucleotidyltransferase n=1 Tax=Clostridium sp. TaxID=1506 RepID=UPI00262FE0A7|nr:CCA tRNA nucleotidyltransferase [Clostridium sp.]
MKIFIPKEVEFIINNFYNNNHEAFMVGGCVRDSILNKTPKDYDITTSAKPEETLSLFEKTIPTGLKHGTITIVLNSDNYEVTTYRTEGIYIDNRHPSSVAFVTDIRDDLSRRDFTINALAYNNTLGLVDYFNGLEDLNNRIIKSVGDPNIRFQEDSLRMLRAIRFTCQLNFKIEENTFKAIQLNKHLIENISKERIRDELCKILISKKPSKGFELLSKCGLLEIILPEISSLINFSPLSVKHNKNVFSHTLRVLDNTKSNLYLRLAALFHDVGKLNTLTLESDGTYRFPLHNIEGANLSRRILKDLRFDNLTIKYVSKLIEHHLVPNPNNLPSKYDVKKLITDVPIDILPLLFNLQRSDINSLDNPKPFLKKVDYIESLVNEIIYNKEPLLVKDLNIKGNDLIKELSIKNGKEVGLILDYLLNKVLINPELNSRPTLLRLSKSFLINKIENL